MNVQDLFETKHFPTTKDYSLANDGDGFVVPGSSFLASISTSEPIRYIAVLQFKQGEKHANHYHKKKLEHLLVLDGTLEVDLFPVNNPSDFIKVKIVGSEMLTIRPECHHTVVSRTETATALELSPQKLDLTDQFRFNKLD